VLTINIGTAINSLTSATFNITNFVNPSSALDQWPLTGGFTVRYLTSTNTIINNYGTSIKLSGFEATSLTSASIVSNSSANDVVGMKGATIKINIRPADIVSTSGYITINFPVEEVTGDSTVDVGPTCAGDGTVFNTNPTCTFVSNTLTITSVSKGVAG